MIIVLKSIMKRIYLLKFMLKIHDVRCLFKRCLTEVAFAFLLATPTFYIIFECI